MLATLYVPPDGGVTLGAVTLTPTTILIQLTTTVPTADCPICRQPSHRVHSRYVRHLHDLPTAGRPVQLQIRARRFFCRTVQCPRWIFAEPLPTLAPAGAHRTTRQAAALRQLGLLVGGAPGARLGVQLGLVSSRDTLLRLVRQLDRLAPAPTPQILGVDDWALRKGRTYGTILIDLHTGCPVDLLPDRSADTLAVWLQHHPGITVISRDRAGAYAEGSQRGAPLARQVADRFHVLVNLSTALEAFIQRVYPQLSTPLSPIAPPAVAIAPPLPPVVAPLPVVPGRGRARDQARSAARRAHRQQRFAEVQRLGALGWPHTAIARQLELDRNTVRAWLRQPVFPERQPRPPRPKWVYEVCS